MTINVELKQHMGMRKVRGKAVERALPQQRVFVNGDFVGYVSDKPGRPFCSTVPEKDLLPEELDAINEAVKKHHGGIAPPESVHVPANDNEIEIDPTTIEDDYVTVDPDAEV